MQKALFFAVVLLGLGGRSGFADIASASGETFFNQADSADVYIEVNPDGSVTYFDQNGNPLPAGSEANQFNGYWSVPFGSGVGLINPGVMFSSLPPGSTINSATFTINSEGGGAYVNHASQNFGIDFPGFFDATVTGNGSTTIPTIGLDDVANGCEFFGPDNGYNPQTLMPYGAALSFSFMPCSTGFTWYIPTFAGTDDLMVQVLSLPSQPGFYYVDYNEGVTIDYTIAIDFTVAPEPRTYALLVGLGLVAILVSRKRTGDRGSV